MERAWSALNIPEDSAPDRLKKTLSLVLRRKQYDRLPADGESESSLGVQVPSKVKVTNLGRTSRQSDIELGTIAPEVGPEGDLSPTPSLLGKVRDAYVNIMLKTAEDASSTSVVPVAQTLDRSLTLGRGFGTKVEVVPTESNLGFKLTKAEQQYLDHLRKRYDGRRDWEERLFSDAEFRELMQT